MNILYLAHRIPFPPNKGDKIRSFHQIKFLSKGHHIHLICLVDDPADLQYGQHLERYCQSVDLFYRSPIEMRWRAGLALLSGRPLSVSGFYSSQAQQAVDRRIKLGSIDIIIAFSSPMAEYIRHVSGIPKIMDFVDVDSEKWLTYAKFHKFPFNFLYNLEGHRLRKYEDAVAHEFDRSIFVSEPEAELMRNRYKCNSIVAVPNGVDLDYFAPHSVPTPNNPLAPSIVFTAAMDYFPNIDAVRYFCNQIFPYLRKRFPHLRFDIVGRKPTAEVRALGKLPNVYVSGTVPDVRPYLHKAAISVAPFRLAQGVQNKILEAMATGLPVVGTSCAFRGIQATEQDGVRIADSVDQFVTAISQLLLDEALRKKAGEQARSFVCRNHQWETCIRQFEYLALPSMVRGGHPFPEYQC